MPLSTQTIGHMGEILPDCEFEGIVNLNTLKVNFPLFDHIAYRNGRLYIFTTKARSKYGASGKQNTSYNLLPSGATRKFLAACDLLQKHGYDPSSATYGFIVSRIDDIETDHVTYYWGELAEIKPECCYETLRNGRVRRVCIPTTDTALATYKVLGSRQWKPE
jgi:hypothetical protein